MLDHLLWGVPHLDAGIRDVAERCGVRAELGGSHPGIGTHNALLDLRDDRYLEIIAPDPAQDRCTGFGLLLRQLKAPRLLTWAARSEDIESLVAVGRQAGLEPGEIYPMSRRRPDGGLLQGRVLQFGDHPWGRLLPFFIQIDRGDHPSRDAPRGCRLDRFLLHHPDAADLRALLERLGLEVEVRPGPRPALAARMDSPRGTFELHGTPGEEEHRHV